MIPGEYNRLYTWMQQTITQDSDTNAPVEAFTANGDVWGTMQPLRANEFLAYSMKAIANYVTIRIRTRPAIKQADQLREKDRNELFLIDGILDDKKGNQLIITAHRFGERNV